METINARRPSPRYNVVDPRRINIVTGGGVRRAFIFSIAGLGNELLYMPYKRFKHTCMVKSPGLNVFYALYAYQYPQWGTNCCICFISVSSIWSKAQDSMCSMLYKRINSPGRERTALYAW